MIAQPDRGLRESADIVRNSTVLFTDRDECTGAGIRLPGGWQVEADFIDAIGGGPQPPRPELTDFATGVRLMEFTEAVEQSVQTGSVVSLPLGAT